MGGNDCTNNCTTCPPGPSSPRSLSVEPLADSTIKLTWEPPEYPNGGITKYIVEVQQLGGTSEPQWVDTDNGWETTKIITGLNTSTSYQFRVRANSYVPGEWSKLVRTEILGDGELPKGTFGWLASWVESKGGKDRKGQRILV